MRRCGICRGDIPDDEPNVGLDDHDVCLWCEENYRAADYDISLARRMSDEGIGYGEE